MAEQRIVPRIGAIPERNGYWTAVCYVPGREYVSASSFHDEAEAREWAKQQAEFYSDIHAR